MSNYQTPDNSPQPNRRTSAELELETIAAFRGFLDQIGADIAEHAILAAADNIKRGLSGVTIVSEDHSLMMTVGDKDKGFSFSVGDWGPYNLPSEQALAIIEEKRREDNPTT